MGIKFGTPDEIVFGLDHSFYIRSFAYIMWQLYSCSTGYKQDQWMFRQKMWQVGDGQLVMSMRPTLHGRTAICFSRAEVRLDAFDFHFPFSNHRSEPIAL
jgi:hypothetical protein